MKLRQILKEDKVTIKSWVVFKKTISIRHPESVIIGFMKNVGKNGPSDKQMQSSGGEYAMSVEKFIEDINMIFQGLSKDKKSPTEILMELSKQRLPMRTVDFIKKLMR